MKRVGSFKFVVAAFGAAAVFLLVLGMCQEVAADAGIPGDHVVGDPTPPGLDDDDSLAFEGGVDGKKKKEQLFASSAVDDAVADEDSTALPPALQFLVKESEAAEQLLERAVRRDKKLKYATYGLGGAAGLATIGLLAKTIRDLKTGEASGRANKTALAMVIVAALGMAGAAVALKKRSDQSNQKKQQLATLVEKRLSMLDAANEIQDDFAKGELYNRAQEVADIVEEHGTHPGLQAPYW